MTEKVKKTRNRPPKNEAKPLFVCLPVDTDNPATASTFRVVAGPMLTTAKAIRQVRDTLPDGHYVLMFEGKRIKKYTTPVTKVQVDGKKDEEIAEKVEEPVETVPEEPKVETHGKFIEPYHETPKEAPDNEYLSGDE